MLFNKSLVKRNAFQIDRTNSESDPLQTGTGRLFAFSVLGLENLNHVSGHFPVHVCYVDYAHNSIAFHDKRPVAAGLEESVEDQKDWFVGLKDRRILDDIIIKTHLCAYQACVGELLIPINFAVLFEIVVLEHRLLDCLEQLPQVDGAHELAALGLDYDYL